MKKYFLGLLIISTLSIVSCDNDENSIAPSPASTAVVSFDFEDDNEGFVNTGLGDAVKDAKDEANRCGSLYRGKKGEFSNWNGYTFEGNSSNFLALDMGACKGVFSAKVEKDFELTSQLEASKTSLKFKYYKPGNFTGWSTDDYAFKVIIHKESEDISKALITQELPIDSKGWVDFSKNIPTDLEAGKYTLVVWMEDATAAIDDIQLSVIK